MYASPKNFKFGVRILSNAQYYLAYVWLIDHGYFFGKDFRITSSEKYSTFYFKSIELAVEFELTNA